MSDDLTAKYADKVTPEHRMAFEMIGTARMLLDMNRDYYEKLVDARQRVDSVGIVLDPTLYRDVLWSKSVAQQVRLAEAALAFLRAADAVADEVGG